MLQSQKILVRGAEAILIKKGDKVIKNRIKKSYRIKKLDERLRKQRTRREAKLIEKAGKLIPIPELISSDEKNNELVMEYISGKKLSDYLEKLPYRAICKQIGSNIAKLHDSGIIHGDLTTSNMIFVHKHSAPHNKLTRKYINNSNKKSRSQGLRTIINKHEPSDSEASGKVYFIDFGLGFHSNRIEDGAVDLHLIKEALEAKHHSIYEKAFKFVLKGYKISKNYKETLKRLEKVEKR